MQLSIKTVLHSPYKVEQKQDRKIIVFIWYLIQSNYSNFKYILYYDWYFS